MTNAVSKYCVALFRKSALRYSVMGLLALVLLYGLFGYFILPGIVQSQAQKFVAEKFHRTLTIDKVEINPYTLLATIRGLKLMEAQGTTVFVGFDSLTVKLSWQSLAHLAPIVQEVRFAQPVVHLVRSAAHHYNFDDLLASIAKPDTNQPLQSAGQETRFAIYNIQVDDGRVDFDDRPAGAVNIVSGIKLGVPFVSSLPSQVEIFVEPQLRANVNGALLQLTGKARPFAEPKEATLDLNLENIDLTHYLEYLPYEPRFKLPSAKLDVHLSAGFLQPSDKSPALTLSGTAALKALQLADMNGKPVLSVPKLAVTLGRSEVFNGRFDIAKVLLDGMEATITREQNGEFNLQHILQSGHAVDALNASTIDNATSRNKVSSAPPPTSASPSTSLQLVLDEMDIRNATVHFTDRQAAHTMHADLQKFDLSVSKTTMETGRRIVTVGEIASSSADFLLNLGKQLMTTRTQSASSADAVVKKPVIDSATAKPATPYTIDIGKIAIDNWFARVENDSLKKPVVTTFGPIGLHLQHLSTTPSSLAQLDLTASVNQHGRLAINGKIGIDPIHTDLTLNLDSIDLLGLQPYVTDQVNLLMTGASLSTKGALKLDQGAHGWGGGFKGNLTLTNVTTVDKITADDFLSWKSLYFGGVNVRLAPLAVTIDQVALRDFFSRVIIEPDGHINLQDIARNNTDERKSLTTSNESSAPASTAPTVQSTTPPGAAATPLPVKIGKLTLQGGMVRYTDNVIKPHYTANLMDLGGTVSGLSSDARSRANVDLHGQVNSAPLTIAGVINPLKGDLALDLKANVRGMELAPLSPYSGRYVGYGIEKGKLSFEVAYQIDQRKLSAENRLILDQLTFGDKIDSPVATKLPVLFAVALLQDRNGVIDVNLPISGSLDSPDFSVGGIIVKVLVNLVTKAVTSPFALLGSMFGGGEEMSSLAFDPGSFAIAPAAEAKLKPLATALTERPALKLDITGWTDPNIDRTALQHAALDNKVRAIKLKDQVQSGTPAAANLTVSPSEYPALLTRAYKAEKFPKQHNLIGLEKDMPVPDMEKLMLENIVIGNEELTALGNQRALAVKEWLTNNGKVSTERLYIVATKSAAAQNGKPVSSRVDFGLR